MVRNARLGRPRVRLFRAGWLEATTLTPMPVFALSWALVLGLVYAWAWRQIALPVLGSTALVGFLAWFAFEYFMHRKLFHFESRSPRLRRFIFLLHENHHQDPNDPLRGLMPLPVSMSIGAFLALLAWSVGKSAEGIVVGFVTGYVVYDCVHWACHHARMKSGLALRLKRHHLRHHYVTPGRNYAVTAIFLDRWFGTDCRRR